MNAGLVEEAIGHTVIPDHFGWEESSFSLSPQLYDDAGHVQCPVLLERQAKLLRLEEKEETLESETT